jgi:hypothetical protein
MKIKPIAEFNTGTGRGNIMRLKELARSCTLDVSKTVQRFTLEGALRRICESEHASDFGVKGGAVMFFHEGISPAHGRTTRDVDIQVRGFEGTIHDFKEIIREVLASVPAIDDGIRFHVDALEVATEKGDELPVPGGKLVCPVQIAGEVHAFKVDVGFYPLERKEVLELRECPSLLPKQLSPFPVWCQPAEYSFADKVHAACRQGKGNGRIRDCYDLYLFVTKPGFRDELAAEALQAVFPLYASQRYGGEMPASVADIPALSAEYAAAHKEQWDGLRTGNTWPLEMPDLDTVLETIRDRLEPILAAAHNQNFGVAA